MIHPQIPHYINFRISDTPLPLSLIWERILSRAIICRNWSVSVASLLILSRSQKCPRWLVTRKVCSTSQWLFPSINMEENSLRLPANDGSIVGPYSTSTSALEKTSINGAMWWDNEAPRNKITEVELWHRDRELSLSRHNKRHTWKRRKAASWTKPIEN